MQQLDLGWAGAVDGMGRAADHADAEAPGWGLRALQSLQDYMTAYPGQLFIAPVVRKWAEVHGLDAPATNFAWGNVFRSAAKSGLIVGVDYVQFGDDTMHTQSVRRWRAA